MLPRDIETEDALAYLATPVSHSARGLSRRRFLQAAALAGGSAAALAALPGGEAFAAPAVGPNDGILVLLFMPGGVDGLNVVVPIENGVYYDKRKNLAISQGAALPLGSGFGLNPALTTLHQMWSNGNVAIVNGVGLAKYDRSHFDSLDIWMRGWGGQGTPQTGWIGRWLDGIGGSDDIFQAVAFGNSIPLHLRGAKRTATTLSTYGGQFGTRSGQSDLRLYDAVGALASGPSGYGTLGDSVTAAERNMIAVGQRTAPLYADKLPDKDFVRQMLLAARLINANVGVRVVSVDIGGFDTHANQAGQLTNLLTQIDAGLQIFWSTLDPALAARVTMMSFSEFGRALQANGSGGTDHGTANAMLLIGPQVTSGFHGQLPSLSSLDRNGMFQYTVDFRSVYATVLERWLGADSAAVLGASYPQLDLIASSPGTATAQGLFGGNVPSYPPSAPGDYVPVSPYRVVDTREGLGGTDALGTDGVLSLQVAGAGSVPPTGVTAVAMNVTAVEPTAAGFVTCWPAGEAMPLASNLNFMPGITIPNLVVSKVNAAGQVAFYNKSGRTHLVVDIVGYFTESTGARLVPLTPARVIDTRSGQPMSADRVLTLQVAGKGDVPTANVGAVLVNMTVTEPSNRGHLTVWPSGEQRPVASSLNFDQGQTIPNLVMAKLGPDGALSVANSYGTTHVVADVVGYFATSGSTSRNVATSPHRILDTRSSKRPIGSGEAITLQIAGVGDVPASGATAVVCNVTVTEPTAAGFLTVWPSGESQPLASSLNFVRAQTIPNLVVAKLGGDGAICIYNKAGTSHVIVDVVGYFTG